MGGFTGAIINSITKSGSNRVAGLFEYRYSEKGLRGNNVSSAVKKVNPSIAVTGVDELKDYTVQLGGPIRLNGATARHPAFLAAGPGLHAKLIDTIGQRRREAERQE